MIQTEEELKKYAWTQMVHISRFGCTGIKCKWCVLNRQCGKFPSKARQVAREMIEYAQSLKNQNKEKGNESVQSGS